MARQNAGEPAATSRGGRRTRSTSAKTGTALRSELRDFAAARPHGWGHDDWLAFVDHLRESGHNVNDQSEIGQMLEKERIGVLLESVPGMGPRRIKRLADSFGSIWRLRDAGAEEIARVASIPRPLAERVAATLR